jgi:hypothetical protein
MIHDLAVHDVLYEKETKPSIRISFSNGTEFIPEKSYSHELMIDEIQLTLSLRETRDDKPTEMLRELRDHFSRHYGKYNMEYKSDMPIHVDYSSGSFEWPRPNHMLIAIETGGIPYGFLSKHKHRISSIDAVFIRIDDQFPRPSIITTRDEQFRYSGYVRYTRPINIHPYPDKYYYFDKEMKRPFSDVFFPKTNKEAKKQARLQSIDD